MRKIPDITVSRDDVVVEGLTFRRSLFGRSAWLVDWRSTVVPELRGRSRLLSDARVGVGQLGCDSFPFVVNWRGDRRRPTIFSHVGSARTVEPLLQALDMPLDMPLDSPNHC